MRRCHDWLVGGTNEDHFYGGYGDDRLEGGSRGEILIGGNGNDYLKGDSGAGKLEGGPGSDTKDVLVVQETSAGQLGLLGFFVRFDAKFDQSGFTFQDPTTGNPGLDDRPARLWVQAFLDEILEGQ